MTSPNSSLDRQNRVLTAFFGWLLGSSNSRDASVDESSPATQEELNGIRSITGSSQNNNFTDANASGEWHLNDDGYMVRGKSDKQPFKDEDDNGWYLDGDGIMKQR